MTSKKSGTETSRWWVHDQTQSSPRRGHERTKGRTIAAWVARRGMHRPSESGKKHR